MFLPRMNHRPHTHLSLNAFDQIFRWRSVTHFILRLGEALHFTQSVGTRHAIHTSVYFHLKDTDADIRFTGCHIEIRLYIGNHMETWEAVILFAILPGAIADMVSSFGRADFADDSNPVARIGRIEVQPPGGVRAWP